MVDFTIRLEVEILVRFGFQEGGNITTAGAVADLIVTFFCLGFRVAGFIGVIVCSIVGLVCLAPVINVTLELGRPTLLAGFFSVPVADLELTLVFRALGAGFF